MLKTLIQIFSTEKTPLPYLESGGGVGGGLGCVPEGFC